jgi:ABC-type sulfate transport system permease component
VGARGEQFGAIVILTYNPKVVSVLSWDRFATFGLAEALPVAAVMAISPSFR